MNACTTVLTLCVVVAVAAAQQDCSGTPNTHPIWQGEPTKVNAIKNAELWMAGKEDGSNLRILHVWGTPYDMGYAQGKILSNDISKMITEFMEYIDDMIEPYIKWLPKDIQKIILEDGPIAALQFTADLTKKYTPQHFFDELQGLADGMKNQGSNITYAQLLQMHMFPELIKASCSMFGAWGPAVAHQSPDALLQLRALDWGLDNPLTKFALLTVYHPESGNGQPFASLTWTGFIGSVTALGSTVGVSEKVWLKYNETSSRAGIPFHFLIRDVAQYDVSIDGALNRMYNNRRTCSVFLGIGGNHIHQFRVVEYSHEELYAYDDANFPAYEGHPLYDGLVFIDKHTQPSSHTCLPSLMKQYYGQLTPEVTITDVLGYTASGDMHAAVYDFGNNMMYVSVAGPPIAKNGTVVPGPVAPAHSRPWLSFNTTELFSHKASNATMMTLAI